MLAVVLAAVLNLLNLLFFQVESFYGDPKRDYQTHCPHLSPLKSNRLKVIIINKEIKFNSLKGEDEVIELFPFL